MGDYSSSLEIGVDAPPNRWSAFALKYPLFMRLAVVLIWLLGLFIAYLSIKAAVLTNAAGQDSHAYWLAAQGDLGLFRIESVVSAAV